MKIIFSIFWFLIFIKLHLFWIWLWQLKEYRIDRFKAHFEAQQIKKIFSSFWRLKYPKFTKKASLLCLTGILVAILWLLFFPGTILVILAPFISTFVVFLFQIPTAIWRKRLIEKAKKKREEFRDLLVIGITGSYGKTSTKEFLATILSEKFNTLKTKDHQNTEIGVSQCILNNLKPEHEIFVVEMGAYKKGEIGILCQIAKPKIGILTGANEQHLATFGSLENLLSAEGGKELIDSLPEDGMVFLNGKNKYCLEFYEKIKIKKFLYGQDAELFLENIEGAKLVAKTLGMTEKEILQACRKIKNKLPGMEIKKGINGLNIIDATYSANPTGVIAHLEYLKNWPGKKVIIMPCLIELGKASKEIHKKIGKKINEVCDLAIITTGDRFKELKEGADKKAVLLENPKEIFERIKIFCGPGDVILLESRIPHQLIKQLIL